MTIASLHRLGAYVEYYQQGGFMETKDQTMKHVCYFDLVSSCRGVPSRPKISPTTVSVFPQVDFRVVLRVQGQGSRAFSFRDGGGKFEF